MNQTIERNAEDAMERMNAEAKEASIKATGGYFAYWKDSDSDRHGIEMASSKNELEKILEEKGIEPYWVRMAIRGKLLPLKVKAAF